MKTLLLNVTCANEHFTQAPDYLVVTLTTDTVNRIKALSAQVSTLDVYSIKFFDPSGLYCADGNIDMLVNFYDIPVTDINEASLHDFEDHLQRMELKQIEVYNDGFRFKANPKHCDDSELCRPDKVMLSELDNIETYKNLDY